MLRVSPLAIAVLLAAALTGCGAGRHADGPQIGVTERDFHIAAPRTVGAGEVRFVVHNHGPDTHELIVIRTGSTRLPLRRDGLTVDEDALARETAGVVDGNQAGHTRSETFRLKPGRYELICNMAGHYRGGMHTTLVVR